MRIDVIKKRYDTADLEIVGATLLSVEEVELVPKNLRSHSSWWWLRSPGDYSDIAADIDRGGSVHLFGNFVNCSNDAVRPALKIKNLKSSNLKIGDVILFDNREFEIVSDGLAFCKTDIAHRCFNSDCKKKDANVYETSDIKKFVDKWFEKNMKKSKTEN